MGEEPSADLSSCITVLIPVKDEEAGLRYVLGRLRELGISDIIVIDGHSKDGSVKVAKEYGAAVYEQPGDGKADAVYYGLRFVKKPYVVVIDGDGTYDPYYIPKLLEEAIRGDFDEVLGARREGRENIPFINRIGNRILTSVFNMLFGTRLTDVLTGLYLIRSDVAKMLVKSTEGFSIEVDIASQVASVGRIGEVPVHYGRRISGEPKLKWWHGLGIGVDMVKLMIKFNPVLLVALLVALLIVPGAALTAYVAYQLLAYHIKHFIWGIIAFQLDTSGLIGILIALLALMAKRTEYRIIRYMSRRERLCE